MKTYEDLENDIVARLSPLTAAEWLDVVAMPENDGAFAVPAGRTARITVFAGSTDSDGQMDTKAGHQDANNTVNILIQANALRGPRGIYALEQAVRFKLVGYLPADHQAPLRYVSGDWANPEFDKGVWSWRLKLVAKGVILEQYDENAGEVLITQITHSTVLGTTVTTDDEIDGGYPDSIYDDEYDGGTP